MKCTATAKSLLFALNVVRKMGAFKIPCRLIAALDGSTASLSIHFQNDALSGSIAVSGTVSIDEPGEMAIDAGAAGKWLRASFPKHSTDEVSIQSVDAPIGKLSCVGKCDCTPRSKGEIVEHLASVYRPSPNPAAIVEVSGKELGRAFGLVGMCVDSDSPPYALNGILLDMKDSGSAKLVATDARRLALAPFACNLIAGEMPPCDVLLNPAVLSIVEDFTATAQLHINSNGCTTIAFPAGELFIESHIEGRFPSYRDIMPNYMHSGCVMRAELIRALEECAEISPDGVARYRQTARHVRLSLNSDCKVLTADKSRAETIEWRVKPLAEVHAETYVDPDLLRTVFSKWDGAQLKVSIPDDGGILQFSAIGYGGIETAVLLAMPLNG